MTEREREVEGEREGARERERERGRERGGERERGRERERGSCRGNRMSHALGPLLFPGLTCIIPVARHTDTHTHTHTQGTHPLKLNPKAEVSVLMYIPVSCESTISCQCFFFLNR